MILDASNCSNPAYYGQEFYFVVNGQSYAEIPFSIRIPVEYVTEFNTPDEFDFLKEFHGNFWPNAKSYFKKINPSEP